MTEERVKRKLTAILSADVVGYSRLMGDDEEATVLTLNRFKEMIYGLVEHHNGRVVDSPGDNLLAEFSSVVDAVRCGVQIQEDLKLGNEGLALNRKMVFRIGINIGDVIQDGDRIYGDGVNIAARIESLADPGGICISHTAYDQVKKKLNIEYEHLGEYEVKNIDEPVRIYRIKMDSEAASAVVKEKKVRFGQWQKMSVYVAAIIVLGVVAVWYFSFHKTPVASDVEESPKTIAVLPFSFSSEKISLFYSQIRTDIERELGRHRKISLASRDAVSALPADADFRQVAARLGVKFILSGIIELIDNNLSLSISIFDTDRDKIVHETTFADANIVQLNRVVADEVLISLGFSKAETKKRQVDPQAYEYYLRALQASGAMSVDQLKEGLALLEKAIMIEPQFALAHAAQCRFFVTEYNATSSMKAFQQAEQACYRAWTLDNKSPEVLYAMGKLYWKTGQREKALESLQAVLDLNPNHYGARLTLIDSIRQDSPELAEAQCKRLIREHPGSPEVYTAFMLHLFFQGRYEEAVQYAEAAYRLLPSEQNAVNLSADLLLAGQFERAQRFSEEQVAGGNHNSMIMDHLATSMFFKGDYSGAAELYRDALKEMPDSTTVHRNLGDAIWHLEGKDSARTIYETVIELGGQHLKINPDNDRVMSDLIVAYSSIGDRQKFQYYMKDALERDLNDPQLMYDIAVGASRLGDMETARQYAEKARDAGYPDALLNADPDISVAEDNL